MHNKVPKNEYLKGKPGKKKDAFKKDRVIYDQKSMMGYRDDSPYRQLPFIDINTPNGYIDMSYTGMPLFANGQYLPPYSGQHFMGTNVVRETPVWDKGFNISPPPGHIDFIDKGFDIPSKTTARYYPGHPEYFQQGGDPSIPELNQAKKGGWLNKYQDGAETQGMTGSMKGAIAYGYMYGNPAAQRMVNPYTNPYIWTGNEPGAGVPAGNTGTHFMASMDNYAVPFIQQGPNGLYYNEMANPSNPEAFQFNTPEEAEYFAEHYKDVAPAFQKKGGNINKYSKLPKKTSSKNIKTSINKLMVKNPLFERNYMLYGAKGPRLYDPSSKYQAGGQREPVYVNSVTDPRYQMYSDSLNLYKAYQYQKQHAGDLGQRTYNKPNYYQGIQQRSTPRYVPSLGRTMKDVYDTPNQVESAYPGHNNRNIIEYYKSLPFNYPTLIGLYDSPDIGHSKIKPIGEYRDRYAMSPIYKKPVQPVVVGTAPKSEPVKQSTLTPTPTKNPTPTPASTSTPTSNVVNTSAPAPVQQPKPTPAQVEEPKPTEPSTKYAYMPTNWGPTYYYEWDALQKKWIPISQQSYNYNTEGGTKNTQLYSSTPPGFKKGGWLDSYQVGGSYADSLALYNLSQGQVNAIKRDPNLINSNRQTGFTGAPGKSVQSSSAYKRLSTNPSIYTYAPGISTNPYSSYYHPTILPTGTFNYNLGTVPSGTLAIPTYKKPVGSVPKSELVKTPEQKARELTPIESKLTPMEVAPEPALYKAPTRQPLYKKTQAPNMPPFYWKFDPVAKQWYQISESAYTNAPAGQKKRGGNIGGLNNYQTGGVTINSEEEYQKSLLMKNKTKERMDAERAWAAKKVAAANAAKAKKPAPSAQQLFGIQPIAAESTGINKTPQAGLDLKNKTALSFHKAVKDRVKANPNLSIEEAQSQLNAEWLYANGKAQGQGVIRQADPEQGLLSKTVEVVSHPFNALDAYVQSGYVPDYFSHSKDAVNPMDIAYSFTPFGAYAVGADFLYNQLPKQLGEGNYLGATIGAASVLPFFKFNKVLGPETRLSSYLRPVSETESAAIQFTKPKNLSAKIRNPNETLDALRSRGQYWDKSGIQGKEILHPDMIEYHGTYSGRPIVEVKMPDGSSEYFYKSTGWAGKSGSGVQGTTEGQWQVYGQHMSTPGSNNWFIKGPDYQSFYGSKTFEDMANNLDFALSQKYQVQPGELNNILNFQNRMSNVDSFIPGMKRGGWLKEEEYKKGGTPRKSGKKLVNYSQNPNFVKTQSTSWLDKYQ